MADSPLIGIKGLYTNPNPFSDESVPPGACSQLNNVVLDAGNIASPRGGMSLFASGLGGPVGANALKWFGGFLVEHGTDGVLRYLQNPGANTWANILPATDIAENGTLAGPGVYPIRMCQSGSSLYATSNHGVLRVQKLPSSGSYSVIGSLAGAPRANSFNTTGGLQPGTAGPLPANSQVAYRAVWCYKTSDGRIVRGAPSGRYSVTHPAVDIVPAGSPGVFVGNGTGSATATRASGSNTIVLTYSDPTGVYPYVAGDIVTVTFADNENSFFKSGTYTLTGTNTYTVTDTAPGSNQTATRLVSVRGPSKAVLLQFYIPHGSTTANFYQVYRSEFTPGAGITPSDEMRLVYEGYLSVASGFISLTDTASSLLAGETLYCSPSQGGMDSANQPLPLCADLAEYQSCLFYANTKLRQVAKMQLIVPTPAQAGWYRTTIDDVIIDTAGPSGSLSISQQAQYIADRWAYLIAPSSSYNGSTGDKSAINVYSGLAADDISTIGLLYFEAGHHGRPQFEVKTSFGLGSSPPSNPVTVTASTANTPASIYPGVFSFDDSRPNRIYFSKPQEPEHVPAKNFIDVGALGSEILRIVVVQNSLFVLKAEGIFRVTGDGYDFSVEPFDLTKNIAASESVQVMNNKAYFLATQGIIELDESGAKIISMPIDSDLTADMVAGTPSLWQSYATDLEHRYVLATNPWGSSALSGNTKCWVWNASTKGWSTWTLSGVTAMTQDPSGILYYARSGGGIVSLTRSGLSASVNDFGSALTMLITPLPFTGGKPSGMKHFGAMKTLLGPVVGSASPFLTLGFSSELSASPSSIVTRPGLSSQPQSIIVPVPRGAVRCAQLTTSATIVATNTLVKVYGFEPVYGFAQPNRVGHR